MAYGDPRRWAARPVAGCDNQISPLLARFAVSSYARGGARQSLLTRYAGKYSPPSGNAKSECCRCSAPSLVHSAMEIMQAKPCVGMHRPGGTPLSILDCRNRSWRQLRLRCGKWPGRVRPQSGLRYHGPHMKTSSTGTRPEHSCDRDQWLRRPPDLDCPRCPGLRHGRQGSRHLCENGRSRGTAARDYLV